jgi:hypothetical protein
MTLEPPGGRDVRNGTPARGLGTEGRPKPWSGLLHFVTDDSKPYEIVGGLLDRLASGSFLVLTHCTADFDAPAWMGVKKINDASGTDVQLRSRQEVELLFDGLDLLDPQVTAAPDWRPEAPVEVTGEEAELLHSAALYAGVGRKP